MEDSPLRGLWQFPATVTALSLLSEPLSFSPPSPSALEAALHLPSSNPQLLSDLHGRLLGLSLGASASAKWLTSTARFVRTHLDHFTHALAGCVGYGREHDSDDASFQFPTGEDDYAQLSVVTRLLVLHTMAELVIAHHDSLLSAGNFNAFSVDEIRFEAFGTDALGNSYWYFNDFERVYREPSERAREKAEKLLRAEQEAREKESLRIAKEEKRRAAQQKKEEQKKRREERLRRNAEKWAPRVAASRVTRAAKRAESQLVQNDEQKQGNQATTNRASTRRKRRSEKAAEVAEQTQPAESALQRRRRDSSTILDGRPDNFTQQNGQPSNRGARGRRRKAQTEPLSQTAPKRPRKSEMVFSDPQLRVCTQWEVLTTDAASLREIIDRFNKEDCPIAAERALVKGLTEHILPAMEQYEAKRKREVERKERAEFLMMNQKRSSRVQAIAERKEMEARRAAQREEEQRFEEERLAAHNSKVMKSLAFEEKEQSRDIRMARKQFGLMETVARDEEKLLKNELQMKKQLLGVQIRRSARSTKGNKVAWKERTEQPENDTDIKLSMVKNEPEPTSNEETLPSVGSQEQDGEMSQMHEEGGRIERESGGASQINVTGLNTGTIGTEQGVFSETPRTEATKVPIAEESTPSVSLATENVGRISSCPLETDIGKEYQWEYNHEDGMPVFVLDRFFFAYRASFDDAPLEDSDQRGAEMVGLGILVPPSSSAPQASRVEIPSIMEWVIEYGSNPKLWVKSNYAWYELRRPAVEYREVYSSARRKYELCVRIAIIGETMRGSQLGYDSIVNFLSMRYGDMKSYKEGEILEERAFIVAQMDTLNRRSLMHSGFLKALHKKIRDDERKTQVARERARKARAASNLEELQEGSFSKSSSSAISRGEAENVSSKKSTDPVVGAIASGSKGKEEKIAPKKRRRRPNSAGKVVVPRAVSSIITSLINAATKSSKLARKRKKTNFSVQNGAPNVKFARYQKELGKKSVGNEVAKPRGQQAEDVKDLPNGAQNQNSGRGAQNPLLLQKPAIETPQAPMGTDKVLVGKEFFQRTENGKQSSRPSKGRANGEHKFSLTKEVEVKESNNAKPVINGHMNGREGDTFDKGKPLGKGSVFDSNGAVLQFTTDIVTTKSKSNTPSSLNVTDAQSCKTVERHESRNVNERATLTSRRAEVNGTLGSNPRIM
ncbi:Cytosine specific DNA methyltransferase replication foci [Gracilaria domingensis]|nr:Cytosine specific DNA methyltransferase replication foci [Gracilaria domingensis]